MNRTLYQLAYRNVKKYKKHYVFVSILIFFMSAFFLSFSIIYDNYQDVEKNVMQDTYGEWYFMGKFNGKKEDLENYLQQYQPFEKYGYYYEQGQYHDYQIGHVTNEIYELCQISLQKGHYPQNNQEIMITSQMSNDGFQIGDFLTITINNQKQDYQIVGIVDKSQDLFPDIYTNRNVGHLYVIGDSETGLEMSNYDIDEDEMNFYFNNVSINAYGYSRGANSVVTMTYQQLILFVEMIVLVAFVLFTLTSTSLKRRSKELALLRSIGMTTKQLFLMILYEMLYTSLLGVICALIASLAISYGMMMYFQTQMGYFICDYHFSKIIGFAFIIMICIMISCMQPIFSSSKQALSGQFESRTFQYIQVRYKKLKRQTKSYLALRELKTYKKLTICLTLIFGILSTYYMCMTFDAKSNIALNSFPQEFKSFHYLEVKDMGETEETQLFMKHCPLDQSLILRYISSDFIDVYHQKQLSRFSNNIYAIDDFEKLKTNCQILGKFPQNKNEVLIGAYSLIDNAIDENEVSQCLSIGDTFQIGQETYKVTGEIKPNETMKIFTGSFDGDVNLYYYPENAIYLYPEVFQDIQQQNHKDIYYTVRLFYENNQEKENMTRFVQSHLNSSFIETSDDFFKNLEISSFIDIDPEVLIIPSIVCLMFCYFINKNQIYNNTYNYVIYQFIGMTKNDLFIKQFHKAKWMTLFIVGWQIFITFALNFTYRTMVIPVESIVIITIIVLITSFIIYCIPLCSLLKKDVFTLLNYSE